MLFPTSKLRKNPAKADLDRFSGMFCGNYCISFMLFRRQAPQNLNSCIKAIILPEAQIGSNRCARVG
jgi:hypothetical protein